MSADTRTTARRAGPRQWAGLAVLAAPTLLLGLDVTVLYLVLPSLSADLAPSTTQTLWIMDSYGLAIAGFLITMGTVGDRVGRRRLLMIGTAAFAAVSVAAAYAPGAETLIAARAALGVAGATLMPSTLALISTLFTDARQRALAIGVWATMFALGMALGPIAGGILLQHFWWGSAFLIALPIAVIVLAAGPLLLPEDRAAHPGPLDPASVALSLAAIVPGVYAVKHATAHGADATAAAALAAAVLSATAFVRRQNRLRHPLLDMRLLADRTVSAALGILLIGLMGVGGVMYLVTQHLQLVERLSPTAAGLWMGPPALMMLIAAIGAPLLARRIRPGFVVAGTLMASAAGYLLLGLIDGAGSTLAVVTGFGLVYLGLGAIAALGTDLVIGAASADAAGSASALSETVQELGVAVGVAVLGSLAAAVHGAQANRAGEPGFTEAGFTAGLNTAALTAGAAIIAAAVLAAVALRHINPIAAADT